MIAAQNWLNLFLWTVVVVWLFPALARDILASRIRRPDDALFALFWFTAFIFLGYRFVDVTGAGTPATAIALRAMGTGAALGILWKKWKRQGWRP